MTTVRTLIDALSATILVAFPLHAATLAPGARDALAHVLDGGRDSHSAAVMIWQDGKELGHYYAGSKAPGPIEAMSVTKSVVALGIGQLVGSGHIKSLDQPVADFYPEWRQGQKKDITIRMLMDHTSGLQNVMRTTVEIYPAPDAIQLALAAELTAKPGGEPAYNNKATNLLSGVIAKASGKPMDAFFRDGLFKDMDIHVGQWDKDDAGHPYAMAGLHITAADLGKLGQLVLDHGRWHGKQLIPASFIDEILQPTGDHESVLLWWRDPQWKHFDEDPAVPAMLRKRGVPEDTISALEHGLRGKHFANEAEMFAGLRAILGPSLPDVLQGQLVSRGIGPYRLFKYTKGPLVAFYGDGDGGQSVVVLPSAGIVAVRQIDANSDQEAEGEDYEDFRARVIALAEAEGRLQARP
jgi:CubicO group peptidase (beta-lactamase class C family)